MRVVIFGKYKTGTTALFYKLKQHLKGARTLFEPTGLNPEIAAAPVVLAKVMLSPREVDCASFLSFEKRIVIVRDPRDWMVSGSIFLFQQIPQIYRSAIASEELIHLLREKERRPRSIHLHSIIRSICAWSPDQTFERLLEWIKSYHVWLSDFEKISDCQFFRYESMCIGDFHEISTYLGISLDSTPPVAAPTHEHVLRRGGSGDWRMWFTEEDIALFRPPLQDYISHHDYERDWVLSDEPVIESEHASDYALRIINRRRNAEGLKSLHL